MADGLICLACDGPVRPGQHVKGLVHARRGRAENHPPLPGHRRAAKDVVVGDRVRVVGLSQTRRVTFTVENIEVLESGDLSLGGRDARGRWVFRIVPPLGRAEVFASIQ